MWVASVALVATLIPIILLVVQLIIDTFSSLLVYEIQLLHEFDETHAWDKWYVQLCLFIIHKLALT